MPARNEISAEQHGRGPMTPPSLRALFATFTRIGLLSFGGPAAQIALMHRVLVEDRRWLSEAQYLSALGFCMFLPGPEATQLATYAGWKQRGVPGGLIAGLLFVLPGALVMLALAMAYAAYGNIPIVAALFLGIKAAVLVIVIEALLRIARRALRRHMHWAIAALAFIGIFFFALPFPLIIALAALLGMFTARPAPAAPHPPTAATPPGQTLATIAIWLAIWLLPLAALQLFFPGILAQIGWFFAKLAVVTFGGAYSVLAYMAQEVVTARGWLAAGQMMDGLGLAETTPGPLILVTEFVAYTAGYGAGGLWLGTAAALVALWATFVPCYLWIFAGAPYIEWIGAQRRLSAAFAAITAAVVGVILNLSLWFALHVLFGEVTRSTFGPLTLWQPTLFSVDWRVAAIGLLSAYLLLARHMNLLWVLLTAALCGAAISAFT